MRHRVSVIFAMRVFATRCLLQCEEDGNADRPSANNPSSDRRIDSSQWERYGRTYSTCQRGIRVLGYRKVLQGYGKVLAGYDPGYASMQPTLSDSWNSPRNIWFRARTPWNIRQMTVCILRRRKYHHYPSFQAASAAVVDCPAISFVFVWWQIEIQNVNQLSRATNYRKNSSTKLNIAIILLRCPPLPPHLHPHYGLGGTCDKCMFTNRGKRWWWPSSTWPWPWPWPWWPSSTSLSAFSSSSKSLEKII